MDYTFILYLIASGFGAGVVTGLAGASAATIVTPILTVFAGVHAYTAITIALFTDVFASSMSAFTFWKNKNIDLKRGLKLSIFVVLGSVFGSYISTLVSSDALGKVSMISITLVSINFLKKARRLKAEDEGLIEKEEPKLLFQSHRSLAMIIAGIVVGFLCGFVGAGGGLMILLILSVILGLDTKTGVGTSVLVMTFTALAGGIAHIPGIQPLENGMSVFSAIMIAGFSGLIGAQIAARFANKTKEHNLLRIVAVTFLILVSTAVVRMVLA